jgi:hypothetical protein
MANLYSLPKELLIKLLENVEKIDNMSDDEIIRKYNAFKEEMKKRENMRQTLHFRKLLIRLKDDEKFRYASKFLIQENLDIIEKLSIEIKYHNDRANYSLKFFLDGELLSSLNTNNKLLKNILSGELRQRIYTEFCYIYRPLFID